MSKPNILIVGAGFAGLSAARSLRRAARAGTCTVTLVDQHALAAMIPALPDYAAGLLPEPWITAPIAESASKHIHFQQTSVTDISFLSNTVVTDAGPLHYDHLIIAMGSAPAPTPDSIAHIQTYTLTNITDATALHVAFAQHLASRPDPEVVINGAGYTGVELAICMAQRAQQDATPLKIHLVERAPTIMAFLTPEQQRRVLASLARHHIQLHTGCQIVSATTQQIELSDGTSVAAPLVCRTEGTCAPLQPDNAAIETLADGRLRVEPTLSLAKFPNVFVAGDAAAFATPRGYLRKAVNFAFYAGTHAGRNVLRQIKNRPLRPFLPIDLGWVIPLGDDSVGQALGNMPLCGKFGLKLHYLMCGYRNYSLKNFLCLAGHAVRAGKNNKTNNRKA